MTVFERDGDRLTFIGDFERLYRTDADPWQQSGAEGEYAVYYTHSRALLISTLRRYGGAIGLEVGCGLGQVTALLDSLTGYCWDGMDISETAVELAKEKHPGLRFTVGDIRDPDLPKPALSYEAVVLNQSWWYVLERIDDVLANVDKLLGPRGLFIVQQAFLKGRQEYAADIADGFTGALALLTERSAGRFRLIEAQYDDTARLAFNDGLMVFRKVPDAQRGDRTEPGEESALG